MLTEEKELKQLQMEILIFTEQNIECLALTDEKYNEEAELLAPLAGY